MGEFVHADGDVFVGQWHENAAQGYGIYPSPQRILQGPKKHLNTKFLFSKPVGMVYRTAICALKTLCALLLCIFQVKRKDKSHE